MKDGAERKPYGEPVTVRLPELLAMQLAGLALIDDVKDAVQFRQAINWYVEQRLSDPAIAAQIAAARQRNDEIFASLLADTTGTVQT